MGKRRFSLGEECELTAELVIFGDFEARQLLDILQPQHVPSKNRPAICQTSGDGSSELRMSVTQQNTYHARDLVDELHAVSVYWDEVAAFTKARELDILLYIKAAFHKVAPAIILTPQHLRWLADLGAMVDVDLYPLGD